MIKDARLHAALSALKHHFTRGLSKTFDKGTVSAFRRQGNRAGPDSFLLFGANKAVGSLVKGKRGKSKLRNAIWHATQKAPLDVDTAAGNVVRDLSKSESWKKLFTLKEQVPAGKNLMREVDRPSLTAPLVKTKDVATPMIVGYTVEKALRKAREGKDVGREGNA